VTTFRADESPVDATPPRASVRERLQRQLGSAYAITRELSGGGSASVFLASEVALDRPVVIKALSPEMAAGVDVERFRREISFAARLQHPHLVPLLSAGTTTDTPVSDDMPQTAASTRLIPWFSMPYVQGQTLRERLVAGRMVALPEIMRLLREIASALAYAHARGIVHRDIKPENVLLCDGVAMVTDFGVAKALDDASEDGQRTGRRVTTVSMALGTPAYMAPEQVNSAKLVDHKADIYAFGCMAYELLTGAPPLVKSSLRATMAAQVSEAPIPIGDVRSDVPIALADVIMQCLEKDPLQRPHSASVIVKTIDTFQAQPITTGEYTAAASSGAFRPISTTSSIPVPLPPVNEPTAAMNGKRIALIGVGVVAAAAVFYVLRSR
jgi:serine/threonine-protein kinase